MSSRTMTATVSLCFAKLAETAGVRKHTRHPSDRSNSAWTMMRSHTCTSQPCKRTVRKTHSKAVVRGIIDTRTTHPLRRTTEHKLWFRSHVLRTIRQGRPAKRFLLRQIRLVSMAPGHFNPFLVQEWTGINCGASCQSGN